MAGVDERHGRARRRHAGRRHLLRLQRLHAAGRPAGRDVRHKDIFSFTHDSVGLGEDGPTHQPVEHLASLRAMPRLRLIRPADANETAAAWRVAIGSRGADRAGAHPPGRPRARGHRRRRRRSRRLRAGRPGRRRRGPTSSSSAPAARWRCASRPATQLAADGVATRVVSMPSWDLFAAQDPTPTRTRCCRPRCPRSRSRPAPASAGTAGPTTASASTASGPRPRAQWRSHNLGFNPDNVAERARQLIDDLQEDLAAATDGPPPAPSSSESGEQR